VAKHVVHKSNRGRGAPAGNSNASKGIELPDWLNLETSDQILTFMRKILIPSTLSGRIGTRQSSAITTACRILLEFDSLQVLEKRLELLEAAKGVKAN